MIYSLRALLKNNKFQWIHFFIILILTYEKAFASETFNHLLGLTGSVRSSYWQKNKNFESKDHYFVSALWLTARPEEILGSKIYFEGYLQASNLSRDTVNAGDLKEAYLEKSWEAFDIKLGRQVIVWGRADKINPTDSFTSKNLTLLTTDDEDQRQGHGALQVIYNFELFRLISIWQPEWRWPHYPLAQLPGIEFQYLNPDSSQNQFGFKLDHSGGDIDWSISYFEGFNKTPDLKIISLSSTTRLGLDFTKIQVYGADFAKTVGEFGIRGEMAYTQTIDHEGDQPLIQNSNIFAVLGADRSVFENFNLNTQILYRQIFNYKDPQLIEDQNLKILALQEAITANQLYDKQFGLSLRPSCKAFNDTLEIELTYLTWFKNTDSFIKPKVNYAINDVLKINFGGDFFTGPKNTIFGRLKDTSSLFFEVRFLF